MTVLQFLSVAANLVTALSYFWIPTQSFLYLNETRLTLDVSNPALSQKISEWVRLAVMFVFACGVHHLFMAAAHTVLYHHQWPLLIVADIVMAIVSFQAALRIRGFLKLIVPVALTSSLTQK
jgi:hypothetical protein